MDRKEFLRSACAACGLVAAVSLIESCKKESTSTSPQGPTVNFTLDLTQPANSALNSVGGSVHSNGVVVVHNGTSTFIAVAERCTHEGCTINRTNSSGKFTCPCHGGVFDTNGSVVSGPPPAPVKTYTVTQNGNILTVQG